MILSIALPALLILAYLLLGGLTATIYNLVIQFFVLVAGLLPVVFLSLKQIGGWSGLKAAAGLSESAQTGGHSGLAEWQRPARWDGVCGRRVVRGLQSAAGRDGCEECEGSTATPR